MKKIALFILMSVFLAACNSNDSVAEDSQGWEPSENVELVAPSAAGGGWDTTARMVAQVLNENDITDQDVGVVNREGGSGAVGWSYITEMNNPHNIFITNPQIVTSPLTGISDQGWEDFTPLSNMIGDYAVFAVRDDAEWENLNDLMEDLNDNPDEVSIVGNSVAGGLDHLQFLIFAQEAGVSPSDVNYVATQDGSAMTSVLNGNADVYSTGVAEVVEQVRSGDMRVLAITSEERLEGEVVSEFPTAMEQGIDATFVNWRGFYGPADMEEGQVEYYEEMFKEVSDSEAFNAIREDFGWAEMYMGSEEFNNHVQEEHEAYRSLLDELGMLEE